MVLLFQMEPGQGRQVMSAHDRLVEEHARAVCLVNNDCARYQMCQLATGCRCQAWGKCELVRSVGQPCINDPQCALGLICRESKPNSSHRCMPNNHLEDLPRYSCNTHIFLSILYFPLYPSGIGYELMCWGGAYFTNIQAVYFSVSNCQIYNSFK